MLQKVMIEVESGTPLHSFGDGHLIVYDLTKRRYYATTREKFLNEQNAKIKSVEEEFEQLKAQFNTLKESILQFQKNLATDLNTNQTNLIKKMDDKYNNFTETMQTEKNSFLKTYKETNAKMIDMIENHIIK